MGLTEEYPREWLIVPLWLEKEESPRLCGRTPPPPQAGVFLSRIQVSSGRRMGRSPGEQPPRESGLHSLFPCGGPGSLEEVLAVPNSAGNPCG